MTQLEIVSLQQDLPHQLEGVLADDSQDGAAFWAVIKDIKDRLYSTDEQHDAREAFHMTVQELIEAMTHAPAQEFTAQVLALETMYDDRALVDPARMSGDLAVTYFATRTTDASELDLQFAVRRGSDGSLHSVSVGTRLQGSLDETVIISAQGETIDYRVDTGYGERPQYRAGDEQEGLQLLKAVFADTLWATQVHELRSPEERARCNDDAREKLLRMLLERRTSV